ncbi:MAG: C45 family autoproteolytic acyltransferase/hydrolase [Thermodesulfobacteriota bacterium]
MGRGAKPHLALLFLILLLLLPQASPACTLWSAAGDAAGGGTLLAKNRDYAPSSKGRLALVRPLEGYAYLGYYGLIKGRERLVAGVNEAGLAMVSAAAGSVAREERRKPSRAKLLMDMTLTFMRSVDEALEKVDFAGHSPVIYMLSDGAKTAWVEVGPGGKVTTRATGAGTLAHANHFLHPDLAWANETAGQSSAARLARIRELLAGGPFSLSDFERFGNDRSAGPDNSIMRDGSTPKSTRTLARFLVRTLPGKPTEALVTGYDDPSAPWTVRLTLDAGFWSQIPIGGEKTLAGERR